MPAREIERPLDMPRAWNNFTLSHTTKMGTGAWSPEGKVDKFDAAKWTYHTTTLEWRWGIARRAEMGWRLPVHTGNLKNDVLGTDTTSMGFGDIAFLYKYSLLHSEAPLTSVVIEVEAEGPTGREAPATYAGGPMQMSEFVTTSGTWDLYAGVAAKRQVGPLAFVGRLGYERRFSGLVQFLVDTNVNQFVGRFKPGDRVTASAAAMVQGGPIVLTVQPRFELRGETRMGHTSSNWFNPASELRAVPNSGGWSMDLDTRLSANVTKGFDAHVTWSLPLRGEDLQFFPIEDIQPTYGQTFGGAVEVRF